MDTLNLQPDSANYAIAPNGDAISVQLDGGAGAYRLDKLDSAAFVTLTWTTDGDGYNYLMAFWRYSTKKGSLPFLISLVLDYKDAQNYTAYFQKGTFGLQSNSGDTYVIGATLEVIPATDTDAADLAIITAWNAAHG